MSSHITATELADAAEGLLPSDRAAEIEAHLAACETCTETASSIASVAQLLAGAPEERMPADVADRLSAIVAAESRRRSTGQQAEEHRRRQAEHAKRHTLGTFGDNSPTKRHTGIPEVDGTRLPHHTR